MANIFSPKISVDATFTGQIGVLKFLPGKTSLSVDLTPLARGPKGDAGAKGDPGSSSTLYLGVAAYALSGHRFVTNNAEGLIEYASCLDGAISHSVIGMTTGSSASGAQAIVQQAGLITEPSWRWIPNAPVYLGVDGLLTQVSPASGIFSLIVAFAVTATQIYIRIRDPIYLIN